MNYWIINEYIDFANIAVNNQNIKRTLQILKSNFDILGDILSIFFITNTLNTKIIIQIIL
jgi:hypothetical protein